MSKTRGLLLGKFAPFHIGHQRLIEIALSEVDEVCVILYDCPDLTNIPLNVRASWVRKLYPQVDVIEGWDAPNQHADNPDVKKIQEEYIKKALNGKKITHFFSSEYYGDHVSKSLDAIDRRTDRYNPEEGHGITATEIRGDRHSNRGFLNPIVYKDILIKVAFVGMPSEEQSRLTKDIAERLETVYAEDQLTRSLTDRKTDFYEIAKTRYEQANTDDIIFSGKEYLAYDSTGFVDHLLAIANHDRFNKERFEFFADDMRCYDVILVNDPDASNLAESFGLDKSLFLNQLQRNLETLKLPYEMLHGAYEEKLEQSEKAIKSIKKRFIK